jgi:signal transduction histidine kinase
LLKAWFGLTPDDEIELKIATDVIIEADRGKVIEAIDEALDYSSGGKYDVEYAIKDSAEAEPKTVRAKGRAVFNERNEPIRLSGIVQDITEQKQDEQRKNDFIGMVSHELKTPLTSLSALIQVLNVKFKNSEDQFVPGALRKATAQVKKMGSMINGFLNVSRLESGKILIEKSNFDIDQLGREVIEDIRLTVTDHQFQLTPCSPINVFADREKISSVLNNLLTNAVKYSPKNSEITLNCKVHLGQVIISVNDQGSGISTVDQQRVFERYFRVTSSQSFTISGFGIGLYLSAEIVERHGGKIWVDSKPGEGSTFYFSLPLNA